MKLKNKGAKTDNQLFLKRLTDHVQQQFQYDNSHPAERNSTQDTEVCEHHTADQRALDSSGTKKR